MGTVRQLAITIEEGLRAALPTLRKTVVTKLALAVGALLEAQTPNTVDLGVCRTWGRGSDRLIATCWSQQRGDRR